ncbi:MAG: c-type cytochrome [Burkholderiales bacterium]
MRALPTLTAIAGAVAIALPLGVAAQQKMDLGQREWNNNCAACHGKAGKGDGPYAGLVDTAIPDVTMLAKRNGGVFPFAMVYEVIDGTKELKAHGPRDMPIWGADYKIKAAEYFIDVPYDPDVFVRSRILALTEYVYRLQAK